MLVEYLIIIVLIVMSLLAGLHIGNRLRNRKKDSSDKKG